MSAELLWNKKNLWGWKEDQILTSPSDEERAEWQVECARLSLSATTSAEMAKAAKKMATWRSKVHRNG